MHHENTNPEAAEPTEIHPDSPESTQTDQQNEENQKRNSGRTGPTSETGRQTSARNATRHGMCATTLLLPGECEADWLLLFHSWLDAYQNPAENTVLYSFVIKTAQAEWRRLRTEREYDLHLVTHGNPPIGGWQPEDIKMHDLILRYLTTAERRFKNEYRMLEHHYKTHHKQPQKPAPQPDPEPEYPPMPDILFVNNETGESMDEHGNHYPAPPDYKPEPIIPGVYPPDHPANPINWPKELPPKRR
jgi:hypothetical protein